MLHGYLKHSILALAEGMGSGDSKRAICPKCHGGTSQEKSFVMTAKDHNILYKCFRAKCGIKGIIWANLPTTSPKKSYGRRYKDNLSPIPESLWKLKFEKYELSMDDIQTQGISYAEKINRIRFPIYDYRGYEIGELLRAVTNEQKPKALINPFNSVPLVHFPLGQRIEKELVLVEDMISAIKLAKGTTCAALLGTNLPDDGLSMLLQLQLDRIILMLDGDEAGISATKTLHQKLAPHVKTDTIYLEKGQDPKDVSLRALQKMLSWRH